MLAASEISPAYILQMAELESGGNTNARNPVSGASGYFGFLPSTWAHLTRQHPGLHLKPGGRNDPLQATLAMRQFTSDNARILERALHRTPRYSELALAHFAGAGGAVKLLAAPPSASVASVLGAGVMRANPHLRGMTVAKLVAFYAGRVPNSLPEIVPRQERVAQLRRGDKPSDILNESELLRLRKAGD